MHYRCSCAFKLWKYLNLCNFMLSGPIICNVYMNILIFQQALSPKITVWNLEPSPDPWLVASQSATIRDSGLAFVAVSLGMTTKTRGKKRGTWRIIPSSKELITMVILQVPFILTSWWLNQPQIWVKMGSFSSKFGVKRKRFELPPTS